MAARLPLVPLARNIGECCPPGSFPGGRGRWRARAHSAFGVFVGVLTAMAMVGCASTDAQPYPATASADEQTQWWNANRDDAEFVPGKGYAVPGVPGYFDENGRSMTSGVAVVNYEKEPPSKALFPTLDAKKTLQKATNAVGLTQAPTRSAAKAAFDAAEALYQQKEYDKARDKYEEAANLAEQTSLGDDALFKVAECHFFADEYSAANDAYEELIKQYPNSRNLDTTMTRQFSIARYWMQYDAKHPDIPLTPNFFDKKRTWLDTKGHALRTFDQIRLNDPTGPLADDALMATANTHFLAERWDDADYHYSLLRKEYPHSEHLYQAMVLGLQSKVRMYQGADYDDKPLREAEQLADQLLTQFSDKLGEERARIEETRNKVAAQIAERDFRMAEYFAGRREYGAARFYYEQVARQYPSTKLAEKSRAELASIADEPNRPPQRMAWLVDMLPGSDDNRPIYGSTGGVQRR